MGGYEGIVYYGACYRAYYGTCGGVNRGTCGGAYHGVCYGTNEGKELTGQPVSDNDARGAGAVS
ncbi:MAG: hypothetical protein AB1847_12140 [bacterium]